mmetsp:Transcript_30094/g.56462  ORF Transcript_30094/g.56462 Transcript_30094/m.56462 type:complete len:208 (-) Transcript_30094:14-637(-)
MISDARLLFASIRSCAAADEIRNFRPPRMHRVRHALVDPHSLRPLLVAPISHLPEAFTRVQAQLPQRSVGEHLEVRGKGFLTRVHQIYWIFASDTVLLTKDRTQQVHVEDGIWSCSNNPFHLHPLRILEHRPPEGHCQVRVQGRAPFTTELHQLGGIDLPRLQAICETKLLAAVHSMLVTSKDACRELALKDDHVCVRRVRVNEHNA